MEIEKKVYLYLRNLSRGVRSWGSKKGESIAISSSIVVNFDLNPLSLALNFQGGKVWVNDFDAFFRKPLVGSTGSIYLFMPTLIKKKNKTKQKNSIFRYSCDILFSLFFYFFIFKILLSSFKFFWVTIKFLHLFYLFKTIKLLT
jgi:hypothetical protein